MWPDLGDDSLRNCPEHRLQRLVEGCIGIWRDLLRDMGTPMQEFVARENIKRFQAQLEACTDQKQRDVLTGLLDNELRKLEAIKALPARLIDVH